MSEVPGLSNESGLHVISLKLQNIKVSLDTKTPSKTLQSFIQPRRLVRNLFFPFFHSLWVTYIFLMAGYWFIKCMLTTYYFSI